MSQQFKWTATLFYSNSNQASVRTKVALNEFVGDQKYFNNNIIKIKEVIFDPEMDICKQYAISGIPVVLVFFNEELIEKYFGEMTYEDFKTIFQD